MADCLDVVAALNETVVNLTTTVASLEEALVSSAVALEEAMGGESDACSAELLPYDMPLRIGAVFIVLVVSAAGVLSVLAGKYAPVLRLSPFAIAVGKTLGTGIIISCALVHMLLPANESLTSECVPTAFNTDYGAYAYLFATLAALALQTIDTLVMRLSSAKPLTASTPCTDVDCPIEPSLAPPGSTHAHDQSTCLSILAAEFGFTIHSLFVGLAVGIVADDELKALLVALCFHQFFEGVSLGARMIDSTNVSNVTHAMLTTIFAVAAPIGIGTGVGVISSNGLNVNGETFLLTQGVFDALCAGLLLQIGFSMLINDFPKDLASVAPVATHKVVDKYTTAKVTTMFVALWGGAGAMAFVGKYL